jgi:hypothetical protein
MMSNPWLASFNDAKDKKCASPAGHDITGANGLDLGTGVKICRACRGIANRSYGSEWRNARGQVFVFVPDHPRSRKDGFYPRAKLVMERELGRILDVEERVLHLEGGPANDDPPNLKLFNSAHEMAQWRSDQYQAEKERLGGGWAALTPAQREYQEQRAAETALERELKRKEEARERSNANLKRGAK